MIMAAVVLLFVPSVTAEKKPGSMDALREAIQTDKKACVAQYLQLTDKEGKEFWPYYNSYQFDLQKINDRLIKLIDQYAQNYKNLSDTDAAAMADEYLKIERDQLKLKELYFRTLRKTLPVMKVIRYMQLENKISALVKYELAAKIPLVK